MRKKYPIDVIFLLYMSLFIKISNAAMSMEELKKAGETMRMACKAKQPITDEQMKMIQDGNFPEDRTSKCFLLCIMEMTRLVKKGKANIDGALKQIDLLMPDELKEPFKQGIIACEHSADGIKDMCEKAFAGAKCFKANNPKFFFP
ncbi:general odorant-binding protein 72-like [Culicoides brevitarsis]|uniref:general odorant-binding protein 72-like n=1 Tax=Culicoides brevitarsis TaxID=469753 RepID=UPI00307C2F1A